jgi:cullin 3
MVKSHWATLKSAIVQIITNGNEGLNFEELYRIAYTLVIHKHFELLSNGLTEILTDHYRLKVYRKIV